MRRPLARLRLFFLLTAGNALLAGAFANEATPGLPPADAVARALAAAPAVQAAAGHLRAEEANRERLEAGPHEWTVRAGGQQRRVTPNASPNERYHEWNAALERAVRLPGKAATDAELGASGVALAETMRGDALHEASRGLLKAWFASLRESAASEQWQAQVQLLGQQANAVRRRQQLGDAARLDAVQAEGALAQAEAQLAQARLRQRTAADDLRRRYPGLPAPVAEAALSAEPPPLSGSEEEWIAAVLEHSHELGIAREEARRARLAAQRARQDRLPDPTFGIQFANERGGEEKIVGAYISIPFPGGARRAGARAMQAEAEAGEYREYAAAQRIGAEAAALYQTAHASAATWQATRQAAERLEQAAAMTARAYQLGEGSLNELLLARRQAHEARLAARLGRLDALEQRYRLLLDAHRLWDMD